MTRIAFLQVIATLLALLLQLSYTESASAPAATNDPVYTFKLRGYNRSNVTSAQFLLFENYYLALAPVVANGITNNHVLRLTNDTSKALQFMAVAKRNGQAGLEILVLPKKRNGLQLALVGKDGIKSLSIVSDARRAEKRLGRTVLYQDWWSREEEGRMVLTYKGTENGVVMMNGFGDEEALLNWVDASQRAGMPGAEVLYEVVREEKGSVRIL